MPEYTEWDYNTGIATVYERKGECNGCGACCKAVIRFKHSGNYVREPNNGGDATNQTGIWYEATPDEDGTRRFFGGLDVEARGEEHRCPQLSEENRCNVHFDKNRLCRDYPFAPSNVRLFVECSYTFEMKSQFDFDISTKEPDQITD